MPYRIIHDTCTIVTKADNITPIQSDGAQQTLPPRPFTSSSPGQDATNSSQQEHYPARAHATVLTLVHAFVSSRLDYCNSVLYSVSGRLLRKLQTVQNAAARVVTRSGKFDHITTVLNELRCMAAHGTAYAVQAGADCFQVPPRPGTVLPHRRLRPCVVRGWSTSAAVRRQQNHVRSTDSYCHRRQELCSGWPTCMEQSAA